MKGLHKEWGWGKGSNIEIYVPADWTKNMLFSDYGRRVIGERIAHEIAHVKDIIVDYSYDMADMSRSQWANEPAEIQAMIPEITYQARKILDMQRKIEDDPNELIRRSIKRTDRWEYAKDHLSKRNRQKVLKEVYKQLVDQTDIKESRNVKANKQKQSFKNGYYSGQKFEPYFTDDDELFNAYELWKRGAFHHIDAPVEKVPFDELQGNLQQLRNPFRGAGFEMAIEGYDFPSVVEGWRYGESPIDLKSRNRRDDRIEKGVSMMGAGWMEAQDWDPHGFHDHFHSGETGNREKWKCKGFLLPWKGSDGEPLMLPFDCWKIEN